MKPDPLGQPAGEQEEFAKRVRVIAIALVVVPTLADLGGVDQFGGVVALDPFGIFLGDLESVRHPGQQGIEGLAVKMIEAGTFTHTVDCFLPLVHRSEEVFAVGQSACFQSYLEILLESTLSARGKRFVGCSERSGRIELAEFHNGRHGAVIDGARIENDVSWNSRLRMTCSRDVSVMGSDVGPGRMFRVYQRSGVMASALGRERAHDGELVVQLSEFFKG